MASEYEGTYRSADLDFEGKITIGEDGVEIVGTFDHDVIMYADMTSFDIQNHAVRIKTDTRFSLISKLGLMCEAFYQELFSAFNKKVLKALFVNSGPVFVTAGEYSYTEGDLVSSGKAVIHLYEDCICILPPSDEGRRVPLCFVKGMNADTTWLEVSMDNGDRYKLIRLGYDLSTFKKALEGQFAALREKTLSMIRSLCSELSSKEALSIAGMIPEGLAAPVRDLYKISDRFLNAMETRIAGSHASDSYGVLKTICDPESICIGMKSELAGENNEEGIIWMIAPGNTKGVAAVELAVAEDTAAATFIYRFNTEWDRFRRDLNRAMEAIDFKRRVISLTEEELKKEEFSDYAMAVKRTASLRFIRGCFAGRVIHSTPESWKRDVFEYLDSK
jgi:hypothetical protein